jgi:uncharacterized YceG family protein
MSDVGKGGIPPGGDPLFDPDDPAAVEREERRREREAKRANKRGKKKGKEAAAPPPPATKATPPPPPRTPEQEFWDEPAEPTPPPPGEAPGGKAPADGEKAERGRRGLLRRRKGKAAAETEAPHQPTAESPQVDPGPLTAEAPRPDPGQPTGESAVPGQPGPATSEGPLPDTQPSTGEQPIPPQTEAQHGPTADAPRVDPGDHTAEAPRPDPNQPTGENLVPGAGPSTGEHRALPPRPVEETGAGDWEPPPPRDDDDWFGEDEPYDDDLHEGDPKMAGAARHGRRDGDDGGRRGGLFGALLRHPFRILGVVVLIVILLFLNALFQPFHGDGEGKVAVVIPRGSSVGEVGELLEKRGVISGGFIVDGSTLFQARVSLSGDAIDALTKESKPVEVAKPGIISVTIPEGQSRPITAKLIKEDGIKGSYLMATKQSKILNPEKYGGKNVKSLEGFLYPDTWEFNTRKPVKNLVALQLRDFKKKIKKVKMKYAKSKNLTVFDVVTIASMIEREAGVPKQRKLVASVIYNRLHEGMTLGIDSTIRFATGNYEQPLTQSQLESESPYNTRTHAGLPPGPINSPGLAALNAAAHPARTNYLFYVNNPNSCNELAFAKNEEEFLADAAKYEKAREKNGGNEPSTCK